jgi:IclR family transcriptional regulator, acetate operon repressor
VQAPSPGNAVEKVLAVLEALADHRRLSDLARSTGLPKSTVHRILQTLVDRDFAAFDDVLGYGPGPRLLGLAGRTLGEMDATLGAEPALRRLQQWSSATVHLAVLAGDEAVYVRKLEGNKPYRMVSRVGMAIPLHCTGIGKAILAGMPDDEVAALVRRTGLPGRTPRTLTTLESLLAELRATRERGWSRDLEENEQGIVCVGAGVRDHSGRVSAAVSVSQLRSDPTAVDPDDLGPHVAAAAAEVSAGFGARPA